MNRVAHRGKLSWLDGMITCALMSSASSIPAAIPSTYLKRPADWFRSDEGRRIADNVVSWQSSHGSWPKNGDTGSQPYAGDPAKLDGTFDNGATTGELRFLDRAFRATSERRYQQAYQKGLDAILKAQYPTGGWPQSYPPGRGYNRHITFNDNAMVRLLEFLREVANSPEDGPIDGERRASARRAFSKGIECILACQIVVRGERTVWCAQHDEIDLRPRSARSYELESLSGAESAGILKLLMSLDNPSPELQRAVRAGAQWYDSAKIQGVRLERERGDLVLINDPQAPPIWARFYDIETNRPFFCGRDGVKKNHVSEIEAERRNGYAWYGQWGKSVAEQYAKWQKRWSKSGEKTE